MPDIILHHYPRSPYAEKVRVALGLKGLAYHSVLIPPWMPKPDLVKLTCTSRAPGSISKRHKGAPA